MELDLVEAARHGDAEAYGRLVRPRSDRLFAIACRILRDLDRAEDAFQDALIAAWGDIRRLREPDRFDAWLQRVLIRTCIKYAARERRRTAQVRALPVEDPAVADQARAIGDRDELERAFGRVAPDQRAILVLRHYLGYEPTEIAEVLGIPAGTARSRLHNAHRAMRAAIEANARSEALEGRPA